MPVRRECKSALAVSPVFIIFYLSFHVARGGVQGLPVHLVAEFRSAQRFQTSTSPETVGTGEIGGRGRFIGRISAICGNCFNCLWHIA